MRRFVLTAPAHGDLNQIKQYLVMKAGLRVASRVLANIREAIAYVGRHPDSGHTRKDLTTRPVKFWPIYSYLIVYNPDTAPIQVLRVLHGMCDLERILEGD